MTSVLVTGSNGQLGMSLRDFELSYPQIQFEFKTSSELDITDKLNIKKVFSQQKYDYCINCAAYTNVEQAEKEADLAFKVNVEGVKNLAQTCLTNNTVLIHISTDYVFDGENSDPYTIDDVTNPINAYGRSKLQGEINVRELLSKFFIVRTSWLYSKYGNNFYKAILGKANRGEEMSITDSQTGCPTNAKNLANFLIWLIQTQNQQYGIHHYTDGEVHSWYTFALKILKENNLLDQAKIQKVKNYRTFAKRPKYSVLKNTIIQPK
ncbi:dTDP-4-dehydrorhamnose reductase [Flavobacteriaceae bacterium MAR_2009_75]|nr:dTDP-4-dehydrorhamnose reductase [Flavobacteriaceae bacterium MAR_2009_75]